MTKARHAHPLRDADLRVRPPSSCRYGHSILDPDCPRPMAVGRRADGVARETNLLDQSAHLLLRQCGTKRIGKHLSLMLGRFQVIEFRLARRPEEIAEKDLATRRRNSNCFPQDQ